MGFGAIGPAVRGNQIGYNFARFVHHFGYVSSVDFFLQCGTFHEPVKKSLE
jgi:hypothetical protein